MNDLISRSDLLKKFNDAGIHIEFDLPVEEILGEDVDIDDFTMLVQDAIRAYKNMVIGTIKKMPKAYDVDAVIQLVMTDICNLPLSKEELDNLRNNLISSIKDGGAT